MILYSISYNENLYCNVVELYQEVLFLFTPIELFHEIKIDYI
jgi:hypothetical protein